MPDKQHDPPDSAPRVLILRPKRQAQTLVSRCRAAGFQPVELPSLAIEAVPVSSSGSPHGVVIFTSMNAVRHANTIADLPWYSARAYAIGPATHGALESLGQAMASEPRAPYTSEVLVEGLVKEQADQLDDGVTIVTGEGGRGVVTRLLREAGVAVTEYAVYRRVCPQTKPSDVLRQLSPLPDIILVPSNEALDNLMHMGGCQLPSLLNVAMVLNNERARDHARSLGFSGPMTIIASAGDAAQVDALLLWRAGQSFS